MSRVRTIQIARLRSLILRTLYAAGTGMTAPEIAATLGMAERSIYNRLGPIHKDGELHKDGVRTLDGRPYTV